MKKNKKESFEYLEILVKKPEEINAQDVQKIRKQYMNNEKNNSSKKVVFFIGLLFVTFAYFFWKIATHDFFYFEFNGAFGIMVKYIFLSVISFFSLAFFIFGLLMIYSALFGGKVSESSDNDIRKQIFFINKKFKIFFNKSNNKKNNKIMEVNNEFIKWKK